MKVLKACYGRVGGWSVVCVCSGPFLCTRYGTVALSELSALTQSHRAEVKTLDGERASLVYDNYARLIAATETIRQMRAHVGGELAATAGATSTLGPAVSHIAGTAESLATAGGGVRARARAKSVGTQGSPDQQQVETVRWVLDAPRRLGALVKLDQKLQARKDWEEVEAILDQWTDVTGVDEVRLACEAALANVTQADELA